MRRIFAMAILCFAVAIFGQEVMICAAAGDQLNPQVTAGDDCFFVLWQDHRAGSGNPNIFGTSVYPSGTVGSAGYVVAVAAGVQTWPFVTYDDATSQFECFWFDQVSGNVFNTIDANCEGTVGTISPYATVTSSIQDPEIARSHDATMCVWTYNAGASGNEVRYAVGTSGTPIVSTLAAPAAGADVAFNGYEFLVVWHVQLTGIFGQKFDASGEAVTGPMLLVSDATAIEPSVCGIHGTTAATSGFAVAWQANSGATGNDIFAGIWTPGGIGPVAVCLEAQAQTKPDIACHGSGLFVVWTDQRTGFATDLWGRFLNISAVPTDDEFAVSTADLNQQLPKIEFITSGYKYFVIWTDQRGAANSDIYGALFDPPAATTGPVVTSVTPLNGSYSSCNNPMFINFSTSGTIDWSTIRLSLNGVEYSASAPEISHTATTAMFRPAYSVGTVETMRVCVEDIADAAGGHISERFCWTWYWDDIAPSISAVNPPDGTIFGTPFSTVTARIEDPGAGIAAESLAVTINEITYTPASTGFFWDGYTVTLNMSMLGVSFDRDITVIFHAVDAAQCGNPTLHTVHYFRSSEGPHAIPVQPLPDSVSTCLRQSISLDITDPDGVAEMSIALSVNGTIYDSLDCLTFTPPHLVFTPPADFPEGLVQVALVRARDLLGNNIAETLSYSFYIDRTAPVISAVNFGAGTVIDSLTTEADFTLTATDNHCASLKHSACYVLLNHSTGGLIKRWNADSLLVPSPLSLSINRVSFFGALWAGRTSVPDTYLVCVRLADAPSLCPSNLRDTCWTIIYNDASISETDKLPQSASLNISPNPFNASVEISYNLPNFGSLQIANMNGRTVLRTSIPAHGTFIWDGLDSEGAPLPAGTYMITITSGDVAITKNAVLLK